MVGWDVAIEPVNAPFAVIVRHHYERVALLYHIQAHGVYLIVEHRRHTMATDPSSTFAHSHAVQKPNSTSLSICPVQQSLTPKEVEHICKAFIKLLHAPLIKEQGVQDNARRSKKKMRFSPPQIDLLLQMKWGLSLLGEEKSREYLVWLKEKLS